MQITLDLASWIRKIFIAFYSPENDLSQRFFSPLFDLYPISEKHYQCTEVSDIDYMKLGVLRCISKCKTGHEFLQHHGDQGCKTPTEDHFFKALKSKRRLTNLTSVNQLMKQLMKDLRSDPLYDMPL